MIIEYPHRIRLRGPWECKPLAWAPGSEEKPLPTARRMRIPCRWQDGGLSGFAGRVRFERRFGYPGRIDTEERVWLTIEGIEGSGRIHLNDHLLGEAHAEHLDYEVTSLLTQRNLLSIEIEGDKTAGITGEVALEIRRTAFLRQVQAIQLSDHSLLVTGLLCGTASRPLDLYLLGGRSNLAYASLLPTEAGLPFELRTEPGIEVSKENDFLRLELVDAATVWYILAVPLSLSHES